MRSFAVSGAPTPSTSSTAYASVHGPCSRPTRSSDEAGAGGATQAAGAASEHGSLGPHTRGSSSRASLCIIAASSGSSGRRCGGGYGQLRAARPQPPKHAADGLRQRKQRRKPLTRDGVGMASAISWHRRATTCTT